MSSLRLVCPGCEAVYAVPAERLRAGLGLRCAGCGHGWTAPAPSTLSPIQRSAAAPSGESDDGEGERTRERNGERTGERDGGQSGDRESDDMPVGPSAAMDDLVRAPIAGEASALAASSRALEVAWIGSLIGAAAMLLLMAAGHRPIGRAWPPSQRVYAVMFPS